MNDAPARTRVLIVDDSAVIRSVISRIITKEPEFHLIGTAANGELGVKAVAEHKPDIVILDIEMPIMDGITALPLMLKEWKDTRVIICSTLSARGADVSINALRLGASECILKPNASEISAADKFGEHLVMLIKSLSSHAKRFSIKPATSINTHGTVNTAPREIKLQKKQLTFSPKIIAIGSSTGGPKVLIDVLADLKNLPLPIVITQHMPATFTTILAQQITQNAGLPCHEGQDGMVLQVGSAYVAPGGNHMTFVKAGDKVSIKLNQDPPENFCRPSVDPMLRSLIDIYGGRILFAMLTGMGADGLPSCKTLAEKGGEIIAQDEESSVVWGMPGAVVNAGICTGVMKPADIAAWIRKAAKAGIA